MLQRVEEIRSGVRLVGFITAIFIGLTLGLSPLSVHAEEGWAGQFQGPDGAILELKGSGNNWTGTIGAHGEVIAVKGTSRGNTFNGTMNMFGESLPFQAELNGNQVTIIAEGERTIMNRVGAGGPAPVAPSAPSADPMDEVDDISEWGIDPNTGEPLNAQGMNGMGGNPNMNGMGGAGMNPSLNPAPQGVGSPIDTSVRATRGGKINLKHAGFAFQKPSGWKHQQSDEKVIFGHMKLSGMIIVSRHEANSLSEMQSESAQGLKIDDNTTFYLRSQLRPFGNKGYAGEFAGSVPGKGEGVAYTIGLLSPHGGGALVMYLGPASAKTPEMTKLIQGLAKSIRFAKPVPYPEDSTWKQKLVGRKLTYMNTTSSSGYDGSYTGSSDKEVIYLCHPTNFRYYSNSSYTVNAGGGVGSNTGSGSTAMGQGRSGNTGTWSVRKVDGRVKLILKYQGGNVAEYTISQDGHKTFLDGTQYFRTKCE